MNGQTFTQIGFLRSGTGVIYDNTITNFGGNTNIIIDGQRENTTCLVNIAPLGTCDGSNVFDGNLEASGWPCCGEIGKGSVVSWNENGGTLSNSPLYGWNNGTTSTCSTGGACDNAITIGLNGACGASLSTYLRTTGSPHVNGNIDYVNGTVAPGYTACVYPHPTVTGSGTCQGGGGGGGGAVGGAGGRSPRLNLYRR